MRWLGTAKRLPRPQGCQGYIEKPIDPQTFVDAVEAHLGQASAC
jgi:DNA-binding response OmpR family regulator